MTFEQTITRKYVFALALVAVVLLSSYITLVSRLSQNQNDGSIINRAGQQRMLSQRTALLMREVLVANKSSDRDQYVIKLKAALNTMRENHQFLLGSLKTSKNSPELMSMYMSENGVDERMQRYLKYGDDFLNDYQVSGDNIESLEPAVKVVAAIARNGFVSELDAVVREYQRLYEVEISRFKFLETGFVLFGLLVLLAEALFIFNPMARKIDSTVSELKTSNRELKEFSFRISHDLRAPIASSLGMIEIAQEAIEEENRQELDYSVKRISKALSSLDKTIEDIVEVTRVGMSDVVEPVFVKDLLDIALEKLSALPGFANIEITSELNAEMVVSTQRVALQQIIENLVSNAIKYSDSQQEKSHIRISAAKTENSWEVTVADNGVGIPEQFRDDLFQMFKRFHPGMSFGTGLGLYLVSQSAKAMGGDIHYTPLETGSQFKLVLPS